MTFDAWSSSEGGLPPQREVVEWPKGPPILHFEQPMTPQQPQSSLEKSISNLQQKPPTSNSNQLTNQPLTDGSPISKALPRADRSNRPSSATPPCACGGGWTLGKAAGCSVWGQTGWELGCCLKRGFLCNCGEDVVICMLPSFLGHVGYKGVCIASTCQYHD